MVQYLRLVTRVRATINLAVEVLEHEEEEVVVCTQPCLVGLSRRIEGEVRAQPPVVLDGSALPCPLRRQHVPGAVGHLGIYPRFGSIHGSEYEHLKRHPTVIGRTMGARKQQPATVMHPFVASLVPFALTQLDAHPHPGHVDVVQPEQAQHLQGSEQFPHVVMVVQITEFYSGVLAEVVVILQQTDVHIRQLPALLFHGHHRPEQPDRLTFLFVRCHSVYSKNLKPSLMQFRSKIGARCVSWS